MARMNSDANFFGIPNRSIVLKPSKDPRAVSKKESLKKTKVIKGHALAIRDNTRGKHKSHKLYNQKITEKEFGQQDNGGKTSMTWNVREKDWYNAERRFIIASKTKKLANKWMHHILMDQVKEEVRQAKLSHIRS